LPSEVDSHAKQGGGGGASEIVEIADAKPVIAVFQKRGNIRSLWSLAGGRKVIPELGAYPEACPFEEGILKGFQPEVNYCKLELQTGSLSQRSFVGEGVPAQQQGQGVKLYNILNAAVLVLWREVRKAG
jgi:hypothetical protein